MFKAKEYFKDNPCWKMSDNKTTGNLKIDLHDEIGFWGTQSGEFKDVLNRNQNRALDVDLNSPGGSVHDGFSIFNTLKEHPAPVNITISGAANSITSVISMASTSKPRMHKNTMMMIHKPFVAMGGDADEHRNVASVLDKMQDQAIDAYKRHAIPDRTEISEMMNKTTFMTAEEAAEMGFAEVIPEEVQITNFYDFEAYNYGDIPEHVMSAYKNPEKEPEIGLIEKISNLLNHKSKEPEGMDKKEFENKISGFENRLTALETENKDLVKTNEGLEAENKQLKEDAAASAENAVTDEVTNFVNGLIENKKLAPVNKESAIKKLKMLKEDADLYAAECEAMENAEDVVEEGEFADKGTSKDGDAQLEKMVAAKMESDKLSYRDALSSVLAENPTLVPSEEE
jgi:ATP-dependent protease ClpP protease subunit